MAKNSYIRVGGSWRKVKEMHVRVSGAWKKVTNTYVRVSGSWKEAFSSWNYESLSGYNQDWSMSVTVSTGYASGARYAISDGTIVNEFQFRIQWTSPNTETFPETSYKFYVRGRKVSDGSEIVLASWDNQTFNFDSGWVTCGDLDTYPEGFDQIRFTYSIDHRQGYAKTLNYNADFGNGYTK